uniref:Small auxin up regulated protein n=1 Tax=Kalanchoe fedtschenkoi TaxID=63787 RepID=A0A7N0T0T4_KALFE
MQSAKCNRLRRIINLRYLIHQWRLKSRTIRKSRSNAAPPDVPAGHVAVHVRSRRYVIRASYLNHPVFQQLLSNAEEEYGFEHDGPITIPCDECLFEEILTFVSATDLRRCGRAVESRPLLGEESVW